eukprot:1274950-Prymnesium_polylepis.1
MPRIAHHHQAQSPTTFNASRPRTPADLLVDRVRVGLSAWRSQPGCPGCPSGSPVAVRHAGPVL